MLANHNEAGIHPSMSHPSEIMGSIHSREASIVNPMPDGRIWSADELLAMTPNERHEIVKAGMVTDVDQAPQQLLELARADIRAHIAETEPADQ